MAIGCYEYLTHNHLCEMAPCAKQGIVSFRSLMICTSHFIHLHKHKYPDKENIPCVVACCEMRGLLVFAEEFYCKRHYNAAVEASWTCPGDTAIAKALALADAPGACCNRKDRLAVHGENVYCPRHYKVLLQPLVCRPRRDLEDLSLCNFIACNKKKNLTRQYGGAFCRKHFKIIDEIRHRVMVAKSQKDETTQILPRYDEMFARKFLDEAHVHYYNSLVAKYSLELDALPSKSTIAIDPKAPTTTKSAQTQGLPTSTPKTEPRSSRAPPLPPLLPPPHIDEPAFVPPLASTLQEMPSQQMPFMQPHAASPMCQMPVMVPQVNVVWPPIPMDSANNFVEE